MDKNLYKVSQSEAQFSEISHLDCNESAEDDSLLMGMIESSTISQTNIKYNEHELTTFKGLFSGSYGNGIDIKTIYNEFPLVLPIAAAIKANEACSTVSEPSGLFPPKSNLVQEAKRLSSECDVRNDETKTFFLCHHCGNFFLRLCDLKTHMKKHYQHQQLLDILPTNLLIEDKVKLKKSLLFGCPFCGDQFSSKKTYKCHFISMHQPKRFSCEICGTKFAKKVHLAGHVRGHENIMPFSCNTCGKKFKWKENLTRHFNRHKKEKPYQCNLCHSFFTQLCQLKNHLVNIHKISKETAEFIYCCTICSCGFRNQRLLRTHLGDHACHVDNEVLRDSDAAGEKVGANRVTLPSLDASGNEGDDNLSIDSADVDALNFDEENLLSNECMDFICKDLISSTDNDESIKLTTGVDIAFPACREDSFVNRIDPVNKDIKTSSGDDNNLLAQRSVGPKKLDAKKYFCPECNQGFTRPNHLVRHLVVHTDLRPYRCDECGKSFSHSTNLRSHKLIHNPIKEYICQYCSKAFRFLENLNRHTRIHTGQKKYMCMLCKKAFIQSGQLTIHLKSHIS